jgi:molybdopterin-guanine dinucleotide biosynthesis protein A
VVGAILAGGAGRRIGGAKAARTLAGRPLIAYPAEALGAVCEPVAVVCKRGTALPDGPWELWDDEPLEPRHPAAGIAHALGRAGGPVLVCAADMPFVTAAGCRRLVEAADSESGAAAVVGTGAGGLQPVLAVYRPRAAPVLLAAAERGDPLRRAVESLDPLRVEIAAADLRSVDTPEALAAAERELGRA